ncbi:MAG: hypothetical protein IKD58_09150 [Loktanella sp.]|nr:hypothetical protein [Loktanella sp.]
MQPFSVGAGALSATCLLWSASIAQDVPNFGVAYNIDDATTVNFICSVPTDGQISCDFRATAVDHKVDPNDFDAIVETVLEQITTPEELAVTYAQACAASEEISQLLAADGTFMAEVEALSAGRRTMVESMFVGFENVCAQRTPQSVRRMIEITTEADTRTCVISTRSWTVEFAKTSDTAWTAVPSPAAGGTCGVVTLDRLERREPDRHWTYTQRSIASNPNEEFYEGQMCSEIFNGNEIVYRPGKDLIEMKCDFIDFGTTF